MQGGFAPEPAGCHRRGARVALTLAGRGVVVLALIWLAWFTASALLPGAARRAVTPAPIARSVPPLVPAAGFWTFGDAGWQVGRSLIPSAQVEPRLAELAMAAGCQGVPVNQELQSLVELAALIGMRRQTVAGNTVYMLDHESYKARLITRTARQPDDTANQTVPSPTPAGARAPATSRAPRPATGTVAVADTSERVLAAAVAFPRPGDRWELLELTPSATTPGSCQHLLPLPASARRTCGRWSTDGTLLLEFVTLDTADRSLVGIWRDAGWQVRRSPWGPSDSFSYLCARDGQVVYAWSRSTTRPTALLLSTSPDVSSVSPSILAALRR